MTRYRATLAYDGTAYHGFQRQPSVPHTIQGVLEAALSAVIGSDVLIEAAGRTDAGVHATGQVVAFDAIWHHSQAALLRAVNTRLPADIALQSLEVAHEDFHPRHHASSRRYRYDVLNSEIRQPLWVHRTWQVARPLDLEALQGAAALLIGKHDFATFGHAPHGDNTIRDVLVSQWEETPTQYGRLLSYHIEATAFLKHMVRRVVRMLVDVGSGLRSLAAFERAFRRANVAEAERPAPPQGLVLVAVRYERQNPLNKQAMMIEHGSA